MNNVKLFHFLIIFRFLKILIKTFVLTNVKLLEYNFFNLIFFEYNIFFYEKKTEHKTRTCLW